MDRRLRKGYETAIKDCLKVKKNEKVVVVTDAPLRRIGINFFEILIEMGANPLFVEIPPRKQHGEEPPEEVAELLKKANVFIIPTSKSLTHTRARREAVERGARGATLPGITEDIIRRTLNVDYKEIEKLTLQIHQKVKNAEKIRVTTDLGTDIELWVKGREFRLDTGILGEPGTSSNLPAGELFIAPLEEKSEGVVIFDASFAGIGLLKNPITVEIRKGEVRSIKGDRMKLRKMLDKVGEKARNVAEFGIGTNPKAKITGNVLEDEKVWGTVHIAFGDNSTFGGKVEAPIHLDGVIKKPTVEVDGVILIKKGKFLD